MAKDALGNIIKEGIMVLCQVQGMMLAQVVHVEDGGLIGVNGPQKTPMQMPGKVVLQIIVPVEFDPRGTVGGVWVVRQPDVAVSYAELAIATQ